MKYLWNLWLIIVTFACQRQVPVNDIEHIPDVSPADSVYAKVYQSLDGRWAGTFEIYRDSSETIRENALLDQLEPSVLNRPGIKLVETIEVRQHYESITPYFQKVHIEDTYADGRVAESEGVNKIQGGRMWCVVHKPDETVIHQGSTDGTNVIIWQRNEQDPQKIEYFRETVSEDRYTIIGWGYYEGADTSRMPPYWFRATYRRVMQ